MKKRATHTRFVHAGFTIDIWRKGWTRVWGWQVSRCGYVLAAGTSHTSEQARFLAIDATSELSWVGV